jgi:ketosteroid isomerase-like protein
MSLKKIFASPQDVEAAFYEALEKADLEAMMAVWSEDDEIVCVHPGGPRLIGYATIREAWLRILGHGRQLGIELTQLTKLSTPFVVCHSFIALIHVRAQQGVTAPVAVTNVYVKGASGWRMVAHHASPVPPDSLDEAPKVLH